MDTIEIVVTGIVMFVGTVLAFIAGRNSKIRKDEDEHASRD